MKKLLIATLVVVSAAASTSFAKPECAVAKARRQQALNDEAYAKKYAIWVKENVRSAASVSTKTTTPIRSTGKNKGNQ